jgi:nitrile hydratase
MNGVHDMGGMHGFGPVRPEVNEPVFHAEWEKRAFALVMAIAHWPVDTHRHALERIPPADYLRLTYYERWMEATAMLCLELGLVTRDELAAGHADPAAPKVTPRLAAPAVPGILAAGFPSERRSDAAPRFAPGDRVRARTVNPRGHTRLPRYVRGHVGTIVLDHGAHVLPDTNAHGLGEQPQRLYTVRFSARDLWGPEAAPRDAVSADLWESYLEPA